MSPSWVKRESADSLLLILYVQPGAKKSGIAGMHGNALKIRLCAQPVEGRANECLLEMLAELLDMPRSRLTLAHGATSRQKRVRVTGVTDCALERLESLAGPAAPLNAELPRTRDGRPE